jgi:hypothetical protein
MYATLEAHVEDGVIKLDESCPLPRTGRALVVLLPEKEECAGWSAVRKDTGWLKLHEDPAKWQHRIRDEWTHRP